MKENYKIKTIEKENIDDVYEDDEQKKFGDKLDIYKYVADIKLRLRKDITADFVLAKLGDKDKTAIIEMTSNAYFSKKLIDILARKGYTYKWNIEKQEYKKMKLNEEDKNALKILGKALFDTYMTRIYLTVILNRNIDKNYLINVLSGYGEEKEEVELNDEELKQSWKDILMRNREKEKEK